MFEREKLMCNLNVTSLYFPQKLFCKRSRTKWSKEQCSTFNFAYFYHARLSENWWLPFYSTAQCEPLWMVTMKADILYNWVVHLHGKNIPDFLLMSGLYTKIHRYVTQKRANDFPHNSLKNIPSCSILLCNMSPTCEQKHEASFSKEKFSSPQNVSRLLQSIICKVCTAWCDWGLNLIFCTTVILCRQYNKIFPWPNQLTYETKILQQESSWCIPSPMQMLFEIFLCYLVSSQVAEANDFLKAGFCLAFCAVFQASINHICC